MLLNIFGKVKFSQAGFEHMTYRSIVNSPTHCATLLDVFAKEKIYLSYTWFNFLYINK